MDDQKIIIIGGGQAGCQTATSLRASGFLGEISIYCSENYLPYQRPPLSKKFLLGELDKERLFFKPEKFYRDNNINNYIPVIKTLIKKDFYVVRMGRIARKKSLHSVSCAYKV
mgnify:CR=1 FL=1